MERKDGGWSCSRFSFSVREFQNGRSVAEVSDVWPVLRAVQYWIFRLLLALCGKNAL